MMMFYSSSTPGTVDTKWPRGMNSEMILSGYFINRLSCSKTQLLEGLTIKSGLRGIQNGRTK